MQDLISKILNEDLDILEMSLSSCINNEEHRGYFLEASSVNHYRLLSYLYTCFDNETFLDIGTYKGLSSLALSTNINNQVFSFNLSDQLDINNYPENIKFIVDDILKDEYRDLILKSKIILLDTLHGGSFERTFFNYLNDIRFKGILLLDDIFLNDEMIAFWDSIDMQKEDISRLGHSTGTGVVFF